MQKTTDDLPLLPPQCSCRETTTVVKGAAEPAPCSPHHGKRLKGPRVALLAASVLVTALVGSLARPGAPLHSTATSAAHGSLRTVISAQQQNTGGYVMFPSDGGSGGAVSATAVAAILSRAAHGSDTSGEAGTASSTTGAGTAGTTSGKALDATHGADTRAAALGAADGAPATPTSTAAAAATAHDWQALGATHGADTRAAALGATDGAPATPTSTAAAAAAAHVWQAPAPGPTAAPMEPNSLPVKPTPEGMKYHPVVPSAAMESAGSMAEAATRATPSLFCCVLTMPRGNEVDLLRYQLSQNIGLFTCNGYQVYSNVTFVLGPDPAREGERVVAAPIGGSLQVPYGGRWGTALNSDVFVRFWKAVARQGPWQSYEWTVKLDADTVFLPRRLQAMLRQMPDPGAQYLNNCKWGMHGPIEVISRTGISTYFSRMGDCEQILRDAMQPQPVHWNEKLQRWTGNDTEHSFGEDQYLRRCLRLLQVVQVDRYQLLDEGSCSGHPLKNGCHGSYASYHPFKTVSNYAGCFLDALAYR